MARSRVSRYLLRGLAALVGMWLVAVAVLGIAYVRYGWRRLETLPPSDDVARASSFRPYREHSEALGEGGWPHVMTIDDTAHDGAVLFFGSEHTKNPDDPQIDHIIGLWDGFGPTVALCESRLGLYIGGLRRGVTVFGEVGVPHSLARDGDVPVYSLEPSWEDEIATMLRAFTPQEVTAFYMLRSYDSERGSRQGATRDGLAAGLLKKRASLPGLEGSFASLDEFDAWWVSSLASELGDWRTMASEQMWPGVEPATLLTRLANASNRARDEHIARVVIGLAREGERVFVVCGGSHALTIEPALRAALER